MLADVVGSESSYSENGDFSSFETPVACYILLLQSVACLLVGTFCFSHTHLPLSHRAHLKSPHHDEGAEATGFPRASYLPTYARGHLHLPFEGISQSIWTDFMHNPLNPAMLPLIFENTFHSKPFFFWRLNYFPIDFLV